MKKLLFVFIAVLFTGIIFSQNGAVKIFGEKSEKSILLQENSRIRIKTVDGKRITGRFTIVNDSTMLLKGKEIAIADIKKIKRNPLVMTIATDVVLFYAGATAIAVIVYLGGTAPAAIIGGGSTVLAMVLGPNFLKGYPTSKYTIEFVEN